MDYFGFKVAGFWLILAICHEVGILLQGSVSGPLSWSQAGFVEMLEVFWHWLSYLWVVDYVEIMHLCPNLRSEVGIVVSVHLLDIVFEWDSLLGIVTLVERPVLKTTEFYSL